jgi:trans-aconitate methyltransferase
VTDGADGPDGAEMATRERWTGGDDYEAYVGRWSRRIAPIFVTWVGVPDGRDWVDVGCGTGALTATILERAGPASIVGLDRSPEFLDHARATIQDPRVRFETGSADALPLAAASADAIVSGLVLNFVPDVTAALAEMARVARPRAAIAAYVWDYAEGMEPIRRFFDAAVVVDPAAGDEDEGARFPICRPGPLRDAFVAAGLSDVDVRSIEVPAVFADFDDYWTPFLSGVGVAPRYTVALDESTRVALRERLRAMLPAEPDGSIHLRVRAWAARGRV